MLLIAQAVLSLIAAFRGWGFLPFAVLIATVLIGMGMAMIGIPFFSFYIALDIGATAFLGVMALRTPESFDE